MIPEIPDALSRTPVPDHHRTNVFAYKSAWFTWSDSFLDFVRNLRETAAFQRRVTIIEIPACQPYGATYHTHFKRLTDSQTATLFRFAEGLMRISPQRDAYFFREMFSSDITSKEMRVTFALLREAMVQTAQDEAAALYSPVTQERKDLGFNLHADLFLTTRLWLIFDDVPLDNSGASLLLPEEKLCKLIQQFPAIPSRIAKEISSLMSQSLRRDSFNRLYNLLHDDKHPWCNELEKAMKQEVYRLSLRPGEGYLIDDRNWLHGRTAVSKRVSSRRFHRLTFGGRNSINI